MANIQSVNKMIKLKVFGSRASGTNRSDSDIDVLLEGGEKNIEKTKEVLKYYSIEQGGPLDLFVLGSVDNEIDLIAAYSEIDKPRAICVGNHEDLNYIFSNTYEITLKALLKECMEIDKVYSQTTSIDKIKNKRN